MTLSGLCISKCSINYQTKIDVLPLRKTLVCAPVTEASVRVLPLGAQIVDSTVPPPWLAGRWKAREETCTRKVNCVDSRVIK